MFANACFGLCVNYEGKHMRTHAQNGQGKMHYLMQQMIAEQVSHCAIQSWTAVETTLLPQPLGGEELIRESREEYLGEK